MSADNNTAPSLVDTAFVSRLVRGFLREVTDRAATVVAGKIEQGAAELADMAACNRMARIFRGETTGYGAVDGWNVTGGMLIWMYGALKYVYDRPVSNDPLLSMLPVQSPFYIELKSSRSS